MTVSRVLATLAGLVLVAATAAGCGEDDPAPTGSGSTAGSTGSTGSTGPAALPRFCDLLTPAQVTAAVGAAVTLEAGPLDSCEFGQDDDPRAVSGTLGAVEVDTGNGGFAAYRTGTAGSLEDAVEHPVAGVGDEAFVATGTFAGGESIQAAGAVRVGGTAYTLALAQGAGLSEEELVAVGERLLRLMADAA
ncbi:hypothetical protein GUY44_03525 [Pimelobacter simplex]|uniref:Uncharacterized protein n=1 Tax=Nocardioides simplex TaxID=2045 RepID=A0A0A1DS75_NOCSI|nr:hypothetical protein [Pimelobacter simplex]AIY19393.1 hypothetical protein KR76_26200 [Pimelobacter simplex]MCG8149535.1 hypothetical protein [Pimelobacter simplex]SFM17810.1 hypothetical protein SAMN05421671_0090 [Pimelobacter simplex]